MEKKRIIAMIVAAVLFVVVGVFGVGMNILDVIVSGVAAGDTAPGEVMTPTDDYVAIVEIVGTIQDLGQENIFTSTGQYNHTTIVPYLEQLTEDKNNVGILLYINSPGGYVTTSDDLYYELQEYKEETGRPIYAYFDEMAASGAYYAAMQADEIYANRMCTTGSIGVYSTMYDMSELYGKLGIKEILIKSGENKGMGSQGQEFTEEQQAIAQQSVDYMYEIFVDIVVEGRGLDRDTVYKIADGRSYTAEQALDYGLIDGIGRYEDYKEQVLSYFDEDVIFYEKGSTVSPFAGIMGEIKQAVPKSDAQVITEFIESKEGGLKYESINY